MNAHFTQEPTKHERHTSDRVSDTALKLVDEFAAEVRDSMEWPNSENVYNTRVRLLAYIAELELGI